MSIPLFKRKNTDGRLPSSSSTIASIFKITPEPGAIDLAQNRFGGIIRADIKDLSQADLRAAQAVSVARGETSL